MLTGRYGFWITALAAGAYTLLLLWLFDDVARAAVSVVVAVAIGVVWVFLRLRGVGPRHLVTVIATGAAVASAINVLSLLL